MGQNILKTGRKLAEEMAADVPEDKKGALGVVVETDKVKVGVGRKFKGKKVEGEVGAEVELEKDQKPKYRGGGKLSWD